MAHSSQTRIVWKVDGQIETITSVSHYDSGHPLWRSKKEDDEEEEEVDDYDDDDDDDDEKGNDDTMALIMTIQVNVTNFVESIKKTIKQRKRAWEEKSTHYTPNCLKCVTDSFF